ncbi:MAG: hypothetical protein IPK93_02585 [Solirubrobacterales bacterium]|nr:hypothetical protein [Solirubrobacterales bacterium]
MPINSVPAMRRFSLVLGCGLISFTVMGCGSSGDVIAKADNLCKKSQQEQLALLDGTSSNSTNPLTMKKYLESSFRQTKDLNDRLRDLNPPSELKEDWNAWIASLDDQEKAEEHMKLTVKPEMENGNDSPYTEAVNEAIQQQIKRNKLAADLGLNTCGQNAAI